MDKILLVGLQFFGRHGCYRAEHDLGQIFVVDIEIEANLQQAAQSDDLNDTLDYISVYNKTKEVIEGPHASLLEHLAAQIADFIILDERALSARVRIKKPHVAAGGALDYMGIEIERRK